MSTDIAGSLKVCFKCGEAKPRSEFYKHAQMGDGLLGKCKVCAKADVRANREKNIDRIRKYDRDRAKNPERMKAAAEISKAWRKEDARRGAAHRAVAYAVKTGALKRAPCVVCGASKSVAHHPDYDKKLDVIWLCQPHHVALHKKCQAT